jgi:hypothetical protein
LAAKTRVTLFPRKEAKAARQTSLTKPIFGHFVKTNIPGLKSETVKEGRK